MVMDEVNNIKICFSYKKFIDRYFYRIPRHIFMLLSILENLNCSILNRINIVYVSKNEIKFDNSEEYKSIEGEFPANLWMKDSYTNSKDRSQEPIYKGNIDIHEDRNKIEKCKVIIDYPHHCLLKFKTFDSFLSCKTKSGNLYLDELDNGSLNIFIKSLSRIDYFVNSIKPKVFYSILFWLQLFGVITNKYFEIYMMGLFNNSLMGQYATEYQTFNYKNFYFGSKIQPAIINMAFTCFLNTFLLGLKNLNIFYFFDQDNNSSINNNLYANLSLQFKNENLTSMLKYCVERKSYHFIKNYMAQLYVKRIIIKKLTSNISDDRLLVFIEYFLLKTEEIELLIDINTEKILEIIKSKNIYFLKTKILSISDINLKDTSILLQFPKLEHIFLKIEVAPDSINRVFNENNASEQHFFKDFIIFSNQKIIRQITEIFVELLNCKYLKVIIKNKIRLFIAKIVAAINFIDSNLEYKKGKYNLDLTDTYFYSKIISLDTIIIKDWNPSHENFKNNFDCREMQSLNEFRFQKCEFLYTDLLSIFEHPKIKKIIIIDCTIVKSLSKIQGNSFKNCILKTLKTENTRFPKHFITLLPSFSNLKTLSLSSFIKKTKHINIFKKVKFPRTLETLDFENNNFEALNYQDCFQCFDLQNINLSNTDIPKDSLYYLISPKDTLKSFYYSKNKIHPSDIKLVQKMTNLTSLFLSHSTFNNILFSDIIFQKHLTTIKILDLSHTTLYPKDLVKISLIRTLEYLNLFSSTFKNHAIFFFKQTELSKLIFLNIEIDKLTNFEIQNLKEKTYQNLLNFL